MNIKFHHSSYEPTDNKAFDSDETYELILHGNGVLSRDWEGSKIVDVSISKIVKDDYIPPKISNSTNQRSTQYTGEKKQEYSSCTAERILSKRPTITERLDSSYASCGSSNSYRACGH